MNADRSAYVYTRFMFGLLDPWIVAVIGDEWGELLASMHDLVGKLSGLDEGRAYIVLEWLVEELDSAHENGTLAISDAEFLELRQHTAPTIADWRERAPHFSGAAVLEETIEALPEWLLPPDPQDVVASQVTAAEVALAAAMTQVARAQEELAAAQRAAAAALEGDADA